MIDQIELLPLGSCAGDINTYQKFSAYLLNFYHIIISEAGKESRELDAQILLDAGNDRIFDEHWIKPEKLSGIFLSHGHFDHTLAIGKLCAFLQQKKRTQPLPIYFPIHAALKIRSLIKMRNKFKIPPFVEFHPIYPNIKEIRFNNNVIVQPYPAIHTIPCLSYKFLITKTGSTLSLVYTPDTRIDSTNLIEQTKDVDYWMLDTTFDDAFYDKLLQNPKKRSMMLRYQHSTPKYSAMLCQTAQVKTYIVIHYYWRRFNLEYSKVKEIIVQAAQKEFSGRVIVTEDLHPILLE